MWHALDHDKNRVGKCTQLGRLTELSQSTQDTDYTKLTYTGLTKHTGHRSHRNPTDTLNSPSLLLQDTQITQKSTGTLNSLHARIGHTKNTLNSPNTQDTEITQKLIGTLNSLHAYRTHK